MSIGITGLDGCLGLSTHRVRRITGVSSCFTSGIRDTDCTGRTGRNGGLHRTMCKGFGLVGHALAGRRCGGCIRLLGIALGGGKLSSCVRSTTGGWVCGIGWVGEGRDTLIYVLFFVCPSRSVICVYSGVVIWDPV